MLFLLTAAKQTKRIREKYFHAILHQQMSWFDTHQIGELNIRLTEYVKCSHRLLSVTWSVLWLHLRCLGVKFMDLPSFAQCSDINTINDGLGDKICVFVQFFCTFIAGFVIGFIYGWKLTLVILAVSPLLAGSAAVWSKVCMMFNCLFV